MPKIRTSRTKQPPEGFEKIQKTLESFEKKLKDIQLNQNRPDKKSSLIGKDKNQSLFDIFRITHQRSRFIYEMYYKKKIISKELYDWLLKEKYADGNLIAKWKKQGYENLCCLKCIQSLETNNGGTCICRVPKSTLLKKKDDLSKFKSCINCGCHGCASTD